MATAFQGFKSEAGRLFDNALDAWADDLDQWLAKSIDNAAERSKIAKAIRDDIANGNHLPAIMRGIGEATPLPEPDDAWLEATESKVLAA